MMAVDFESVVTRLADTLTPAGTMLPFAGKTVPSGWLLCNGAAVSRTTYSRLFAAIGTSWGTGDGSTTFNLPNCDSRFLEGTTDASKVGTYLEAGLPNITGGFYSRASGYGSTATELLLWSSGALNVSQTSDTTDVVEQINTQGAFHHVTLSATLANNIYGNSSTVTPPSCQTLIIIKV